MSANRGMQQRARMSALELIGGLQEITERWSREPEEAHLKADELLLAFALSRSPSNELEIEEAWGEVPKWYA